MKPPTLTSSASHRRTTATSANARRIVILGGDETGLAVARNGARHDLSPVVFARARDITTRSRFARCVIIDAMDEAARLMTLMNIAEGDEQPPLVATNDRWLRFLVAHRAVLEERFAILHPGNDVLEICLSKRRFATWAAERGIPSPALVEVPNGSQMEPRSLANLPYPLLLRPEWSNQIPPGRVPKAVPIASASELRAAIEGFESERCPWVATRSLLGHIGHHYSVAVAVRGDESLTLVAEKIRPLPEQCAVGTYVALRPHPEAEALALATLRAVGFSYGIAEVEIAVTRPDNAPYVIEINPRPWSQFALSYRSGRDFLLFLLGPSRDTRRWRFRDDLCWIDVTNDLFACFSRASGLVRRGRIQLDDYLRSLCQVRVFARFAPDDPYPAVRHFFSMLRVRLAHRLLVRHFRPGAGTDSC